ncbi:MAG: pepsin/retropepsin-like aspartic protease family protein [Candidatus Kapaibacteriota bacterium]
MLHNETFLEKVRCLELDSLKFKELTNEELDFLDVVQYLLQNEFHLVERDVKTILAQNDNNTFKYEYLQFLTYSFLFQSKWKELLPNRELYFYDPDSVFLLAQMFSTIDTQRIFFKKGIDSLSFTIAPNGAIIIQVQINGKTRNFWFDSGSNYSIVSSKTAEDCNLPIITKEKSKAITYTNYKVDVIPTYIPTLSFGNIEIVNHPALIVDDYNLKLNLWASKVPVEIYGILGWRFMQNFKVTIDYNKNTIILEKPNKKSNLNPNFFWYGVPIVIGKFQNKKMLFALDLGSERSYLTENVFQKVSFQKIYEQTKKIGSVGGWKFSPSWVVPYFEVYIDTFKVSFYDINTLRLSNDYFFKLDGILGLDIFKKSQISFDILNSEFRILRKY